jgi:hypothetical protein
MQTIVLRFFLYNFIRYFKFINPETFTEEEYKTFKTFGLNNISVLPNFLKFHFYNFIILSVGVLVYYLNKLYPSFTFLEIVWKIILFFWVPKMLVESYRYQKYKYKEQSFYKKMNNIINTTFSYQEFQYQYDQEFNKSKLGKWLIKKFIRK